MSIDLVKRLATFVVLVLVQGLVFNHIHLFNCATPLLYIIMVLHFRRNHPKWAVLLWCFMMGLCVDAFAVYRRYHHPARHHRAFRHHQLLQGG